MVATPYYFIKIPRTRDDWGASISEAQMWFICERTPCYTPAPSVAPSDFLVDIE